MCTPASRLQLVALAGHRAGLVVGDDELAVVVELEPVDDAAQLHARRRWRASRSSRPIGRTVVGSSSSKYCATSTSASAWNASHSASRELEAR